MDSLIIFVLMWVNVLVSCANKSSLEITTYSGKVKGFTVRSVGRKGVDVFLGIPFGASTDGRNRFAPPREVDPWDGVFNASAFSRPCNQVVEKKMRIMPWVSKGKETEDCLKLNIWVPNSRSKSKAVMVWIHGGAFKVGSSDIPLWNGTILAAHEDVVVVSLNYRLSAFGFLYFAHQLAPGNVGLMDQALGLKWIVRNIKAFGGDPERITIFGQSAGGASVSFHLIAPSSLDLFQNAIMQSGSINSLWAIQEPKFALAQSFKLAELAGCPANKDKREETIRCLQDLHADELSKAVLKMNSVNPIVLFGPVVDGEYLPETPSELLSQGKFCSEKNVLLGYTRDDGSFILYLLSPQYQRSEETFTEDDLTQVITKNTYPEGQMSDLLLESVSLFYRGWGSDNSSSLGRIIQFLTDRWFGCDLTNYAEKLAHKGNKVYFYRFDHIGDRMKSLIMLPKWFGAAHGSELPFLFGRFYQKEMEASTVDFRLSKQLMRYWANFAKKGDPNDDYLPLWSRYTVQDKHWLRIDGKSMEVENVRRQKECTFWEKIFPKMKSMQKEEL